jgi:hypothetical protein
MRKGRGVILSHDNPYFIAIQLLTKFTSEERLRGGSTWSTYGIRSQNSASTAVINAVKPFV